MKQGKLYLHLFYWSKEFVLAPCRIDVKKAYLLKTGDPVKLKVTGDRIRFSGLPTRAPDPLNTVIALEYEGEPESLESFRELPQNAGRGKARSRDSLGSDRPPPGLDPRGGIIHGEPREGQPGKEP